METPKDEQETCAICLGGMKAGRGQALFTAECSHVFHFNCIASNVQHGNRTCPTCRSSWTHLPFQAPQPQPPPTRPTPSRFSDDEPLPTPTAAPEGAAASSWTHLPFFAPTPYPPFPTTTLFNPTPSPLFPTTPLFDPTPSPLFHPAPSRAFFNPTPFFNNPRQPCIVPQPPPNFADDEPLPTPTPNPPPEGGAASCAAPPPQLGVGGDMTVKALPEYPALSRSDESDSFAVLVGIRAPPLSPEASDRRNTSRAPIDLVAVLDVSDSMGGDKILLLKEAVRFVINHLGPSDRLSIVTFSTNARRVTPLRRMTASGQAETTRAVDALRIEWSTNIIAGLQTAVQVLEQRREKNPVTSIILLSDGQDNQNGHGHGFFRALGGLPPSVRSRNPENVTTNEVVPVHTFGFGKDHDATALHAVADGSGGTFSYIESIKALQDAFALCIGGLLSVVSQDAEIRLQSGSPGVQILSIPSGRYRNTITDDSQKGVIHIGDLYAEEEKQFLVYLSIPQETTQLLEVNCSYKDPLSKETKTPDPKTLEIKRPLAEDLTEEDKKVCLEVDRERNRISISEGITKAQAMAERGDLHGAQSVLGQRMGELMGSAAGRAGDGFCSWMGAGVEELSERMKDEAAYETGGRAFGFSLASEHMTQRASTQAVFGTSKYFCAQMAPSAAGQRAFGMGYRTPVMQQMVIESQQQRQSTNTEEGDHTTSNN